MDIVLIIMIVVVSLLLLYVNVYLLALYCHPDDGGFGASLICKIIVILGLTLSWAQILLLPVDVSNTRNDYGLNMDLAWMIVYGSVLAMTTIIIPFAIFFYESDEDKPFIARLCITFFQEFIILALSCLILFVTYSYLNQAKIPVQVASLSVNNFTLSNSTLSVNYTSPQNNSRSTLDVQVTLITFSMGLMCFVGYIFLIIFGGIGLVALPLDLIRSFRIRPVFRSSQEAAIKKKQLKTQTEELIKKALILKEDDKDIQISKLGWFSKNKKGNKIKNAFTNIELQVDALREVIVMTNLKEYEIFKLELSIEQSNPLVYCLSLCIGVILLAVTVVWWIHILLYVIIKKNGYPYSPFLNKMFITLDEQNVNFIGVFFYGLFTLYLLWCVTKGNLKCGIKIPYILTLHPMKLNGTWMNSFLFNIVLILFSSVAVIHFSTSCFSEYTRLTTIQNLFGIQIKYLVLLSWAFENDVFEYSLFVQYHTYKKIQGWSILAGIVQCLLTVRKSSVLVDIEAKRKLKTDHQKKNDKAGIELEEYFIKKK